MQPCGVLVANAAVVLAKTHVKVCSTRAMLCCAVLRCWTDRSVPNLSYKEVQKVVVDAGCSSYAVQGDDEVRGPTRKH